MPVMGAGISAYAALVDNFLPVIPVFASWAMLGGGIAVLFLPYFVAAYSGWIVGGFLILVIAYGYEAYKNHSLLWFEPAIPIPAQPVPPVPRDTASMAVAPLQPIQATLGTVPPSSPSTTHTISTLPPRLRRLAPAVRYMTDH